MTFAGKIDITENREANAGGKNILISAGNVNGHNVHFHLCYRYLNAVCAYLKIFLFSLYAFSTLSSLFDIIVQ